MSLWRTVLAWLAIVAGSAAALKTADCLPALIAGTPQGVRVYSTLNDAEHAVGARVWLPAYYPDSLAWPPERVDAWPGPPVMVAVRVSGRADHREKLVIVESLWARAAADARLLPAAPVLLSSDIRIGDRAARLDRVVAPGGEVLHDVTWDQGRRRLTLRYRGPVEELLTIADSMERMHR